MPSEPESVPSREARLAEVRKQFYRDRTNGVPVSESDLVGAHPDLKVEISALFAQEAVFDALGAEGVGGTTASYRGTNPGSPWGDQRLVGRGTVIGQYKVVSPLEKQGGLGSVYRAEGPNNSQVVIKITKGDGLAANKAHNMVKLWKVHLVNRNIQPILGMGWYGSEFYYVTEFHAAGDLMQRMARKEFHAREAAEIVRGAAEAIAFANGKGVYHRDLKPRNILIDRNNEAMVMDFDNAALDRRAPSTGSSMSRTIGFRGTPGYWPPERARGDANSADTPQAEVYSLGATLYEILVGQPYIQGENPDQVAANAATKKLTGPRDVSRNIPEPLDRICRKCLQPAANDRFQTAGELADNLQRYLDGGWLTIPPASPINRLFWWLASNQVITSLLLLVAVLVGGVKLSELYQEGKFSKEVQDTNTYIAQQAAETALAKFNLYGLALVEATDDSKFRAAWLDREKEGGSTLKRYLDDRITYLNRKDPRMRTFSQQRPTPIVASLYVMAPSYRPDGSLEKATMIARSPDLDTRAPREFVYRDYVQGALAHARAGRVGIEAVHVSKVFHSKWDNLHKFAMSVPFRSGQDQKGEADGVLVMTLNTDTPSTLVGDENDDIVVALIARAEPSSAEPTVAADASQSEHVVFLHPGYGRAGVTPVRLTGNNTMLPEHDNQWPELVRPEGATRLASSAKYRDPVGQMRQAYAVDWVVGRAQVGNTGMYVFAQQKYANAVEQKTLDIRVFAYSLAAVGVFLMCLQGWRAAPSVIREKSRSRSA